MLSSSDAALLSSLVPTICNATHLCTGLTCLTAPSYLASECTAAQAAAAAELINCTRQPSCARTPRAFYSRRARLSPSQVRWRVHEEQQLRGNGTQRARCERPPSADVAQRHGATRSARSVCSAVRREVYVLSSWRRCWIGKHDHL